jgi:hypothetical protein
MRRNYENYGKLLVYNSTHTNIMRQPILLALLAFSTFFYFHNRLPPTPAVSKTVAPQPARSTAAAPSAIIVVAAPPSYNRWKTGPNAQTDFEPFAPNEQATWNHSSGYTIVGGRH